MIHYDERNRCGIYALQNRSPTFRLNTKIEALMTSIFFLWI